MTCQKSDFCEATTLVTGSPEKGDRVADEVGAERVLSYEEFQEGEGADAYDAVYVATPTGRHLEYVETAAELGKNSHHRKTNREVSRVR